jgi:hypothetical protein
MSPLTYFVAAILMGLMIAGFLAGGIYSTVPVSGGDSTGHVVVVNRFTGTVKVCRLFDGNPCFNKH